MKLTTPQDFEIPEDRSNELILQIEKRFERHSNKFDNNETNRYSVTLHADGKYTQNDCEKVREVYMAQGWTMVFFNPDQNLNTTNVTFVYVPPKN